MQRETDFGALSPKWNVSVKLLSSRLRDLGEKGGTKLLRLEVLDDRKLSSDTMGLKHKQLHRGCDCIHNQTKSQH